MSKTTIVDYFLFAGFVAASVLLYAKNTNGTRPENALEITLEQITDDLKNR